MTGTKGETENFYSYDGFGNIFESREDITNRILYTGQQYDRETEQYYLRARYYNPVIGRFMQEDTYRGDGLNLYAYCANNPVGYYDPSGHTKQEYHAESKTPTSTPAGGNKGGSETTNRSNFKWGNPKSIPTYGHTFSQHGQKQTLQQLIDRANGFENPHQVGQWLNNQQAADFLADAVKNRGGGII